MEKFTNFIIEYYFLFDIISIFLIFSLIGYFVEKKKKKATPFKIVNEENKSEEINLKEMQNQVSNNVSLSEFVNKNIVKNENNNQNNNG